MKKNKGLEIKNKFQKCKKPLPCGGRAECYGVISSSTCKCTCWIVVSVAVRSGARRFKHLRIHRRLTRVGRTIRATTTVLRLPKSLTCALTSRAVPGSQLSRALLIQVSHAPGWQARARPAIGVDDHWYIVAIYKADVVEILVARCDRELRESSGWVRPGAIAFELVGATVACGTATLTGIGIKSTTGSAPKSSGPVGWCLEGTGLTG